MAEWQLEFPPEVAEEREQVIAAILRLMDDGMPLSVREACRIQGVWLERYPRDYGMLDLGESLWMLADALAIMEEKGIAPLERSERVALLLDGLPA